MFKLFELLNDIAQLDHFKTKKNSFLPRFCVLPLLLTRTTALRVLLLTIYFVSTFLLYQEMFTLRGILIKDDFFKFKVCAISHSYKKDEIENDKNDSTIDIVKGEKWKRIQSGDNNINKYL